MVGYLTGFKWFRHRSPDVANAAASALPPLPPGAFPVLAARDLLAGRRMLVNRIEEAAATTRPHFERYYLGALWHFAAWAQQFPFPEGGRGYPGGLLDHGLESAKAALLIRQGRLLPPGAPPEESALKQSLWTYAVFTLALLGAAQPAVGLAVTVSGDDATDSWAWNPWAGAVGNDPKARSYQVASTPGQEGGHLWRRHTGILLASHLVDAGGLAWLQSEPVLFRLWLATAYGDDAHAGVLADIITQAGWEPACRADAAVPRVAGNTGPPLGRKTDFDARASAKQSAPLDGSTAIIPPQPIAETSLPSLAATLGVDAESPLRGGNADSEPLVAPDPPTAVSPHPPRTENRRSGNPGAGNSPAATPGRECLAWIVSGIQSGSIPCNERDARVHGVPEGVLLASPGIFQDYAKSVGGVDFDTVQRSFLKLRLHQTTSAGVNIHRYAVSGRGSAVNGLLLPDPKAVFGAAAPGLNPLLERL